VKSATTRTGTVIHKSWFRITYFLQFVHNHVFKHTVFSWLGGVVRSPENK